MGATAVSEPVTNPLIHPRVRPRYQDHGAEMGPDCTASDGSARPWLV